MANYPPNTQYMQQQQQQQVTQQQLQRHQQAMYMQQQAAAAAGMHPQISSDGSIRQGIPQHMIPTMMQGQRPPPQHLQPQQRIMMMPTSQAQHIQQIQQQQQQLQQRPMNMNPSLRQMMVSTSQPQQPQHYIQQYNQAQHQRGTAPPPSSTAGKIPPQQLQIRPPEGMRAQLQMAQPMIIRTSGEHLPPHSVIIQQPPHLVTSSSSPAYIRSVQPSQSPQVRSHPQGQYIRPVAIQRRPDQEMHPASQYVIRQGLPPPGYTAIAITPTSGGEQQYQIVQQANFPQASVPGQVIRQLRPIQASQSQTPLRMALAQPSQSNMMMQPVMVLQQGMPPPEGVTPMIIEQNPAAAVASTSTAPPSVATTVAVKPAPAPTPTQAASTPRPVAPAAASKTANRPTTKKSTKSKAKPNTIAQTSAQSAPTPKKPESSANLLTPQAKLIDAANFEDLLSHLGAKDSLEPSVRNAIAEFAESYAEYLVSELIESARIRKVNKIENRDAKFVISLEQNKNRENEGKKK